MASYHLSVKTVQRSAGRSATAAAYRSGELIACAREGRVHDYTRKAGVEDAFILAPEDAPAWAQDRAALWNAAEARETRANSVTAREWEWELALPAELDGGARRLLVARFAAELVSRYGVAADVAIHAPHRERQKRGALGSGWRGSWTGAPATKEPRWRRRPGRGTTRTTSARGSGVSLDERWSRLCLRRAPQRPGRRRGASASSCRQCWHGKSRLGARSPRMSGRRSCTGTRTWETGMSCRSVPTYPVTPAFLTIDVHRHDAYLSHP